MQSEKKLTHRRIPVLRSASTVLLPQESIPFCMSSLTVRQAVKASELTDGWLLLSWEAPYRPHATDEADSIGCLARVVSHGTISSNDEVSSNDGVVLLKGFDRVRFHFEEPDAGGVLFARVLPKPDRDSEPNAGNRVKLRQQLTDHLRELLPELAMQNMGMLIESELPLDQLCDLAAASVEFRLVDKQSVLQEFDVDDRCRLVLNCLEQSQQSSREQMFEYGLN